MKSEDVALKRFAPDVRGRAKEASALVVALDLLAFAQVRGWLSKGLRVVFVERGRMTILGGEESLLIFVELVGVALGASRLA